jgi:uncharacterized protein (TIGR02271 family)
MGLLDKDNDGSIRDDAQRAADKAANKSGSAADNALRAHHDEPATTGDVVGEGVGGFSGLAAGAAIGSLGGPIGTVIGAIAGAASGWWTGRAVSEAASSFNNDEDYYRNHFETTRSKTTGTAGTSASDVSSYDRARPAYQLGHLAGNNPEYRDRNFDEVETDLRAGWNDDVSAQHGRWEDVRPYARDAYERGRERLVLSEEQLAVGKRQVQAGEVELRKTVETEHVRESVPLVHEEVTIERRPLSADANVRGDIGEDSISVPLMAEEAVVDKRVVAKEEVTLNKRAVTEERVVEEDLRRERLVTDDATLRGSAGTDVGGTTGGSTGGAARRAGNALDDLKDRVDGNPASRPGPDATDRDSRF